MVPPSPVTDPVVRRLSWATLGFTVVVILGGAVVRATDSGAGCGDSWPRCEGHIIPFSAQGSTLVEFTHRAMTALLAVALVTLMVMVFRRHGKGEPVRRALNWSIGFFIVEALIGAALVLFGWVDDDASLGRVIVVPLHLINTFLLLGALTLTAHFAGGGRRLDLARDRGRARLILAGVGMMLLIGVSGALNALADTLGEEAGRLYELRVIHPLIAVAGAGVVLMIIQAPALGEVSLARLKRAAEGAPALGWWLGVLILVQFAVGLFNIVLLTPVETQVLHLLVADILWILWVRIGAILLAAPAVQRQAVAV